MTTRSRTNSARLIEKGHGLIPGAVNSPLRGFKKVGGAPICVKGAQGARVVDVDGNEYIDFLGGFGPVILGHSDPGINAAVVEQLPQGTVYALTNAFEYDLAEMIIASSPCLERVRFTCSGTEAVMSAVRLAKGFTGRNLILKFEGSYHGHADTLLSDGRLKDLGKADGIDPALHAHTLMARYNDLASVGALCAAHGKEIAAILVEPFACNMGLVPPAPGFLAGLRRLADETGALLIFDEVITGFRMTYGSVSTMVGVRPDLVTFGKIIGGGMPIGAYGGRADVMLHLDAEDGVLQCGTFAGNALSMVAGIAVLKRLRDGDVYERLERLGQRLEVRLVSALAEADIPYRFVRQGSVFTLFFVEDGRWPRDHDDVATQNEVLFSRYHQAMLDKGFVLAPSADEVSVLMSAHTEADVDLFADTIVATLARLRKETR
jgi:glutamate-1-semialdehyde 2,1-aminomutase